MDFDEDDGQAGMADDDIEEEDEKPKPRPIVNMNKAQTDFDLKYGLFTGILQLLTSPFGIGYLWSITHGCTLLENA